MDSREKGFGPRLVLPRYKCMNREIRPNVLSKDVSTMTNRVSFFVLLLAAFAILSAPMLTGCCGSGSLTDTKRASNMSPEWYSGSVVDINPAENIVTLAIDEPKHREAVFSLEKMSDSYKKWAFSVMKPGDSVSASCLSELIEKGGGINIVVSFQIKGHEDEEAAISEKDVADAIASAR